MYIYVPSGKMIKNYFWRSNAPWFPFPIFTSHIAMKKEKKTEEKKIAICTLGLTLWNQNWDSQQGRELAMSGSNNFFFNSANLILMLIGKSGIIKFEFQTT